LYGCRYQRAGDDLSFARAPPIVSTSDVTTRLLSDTASV
jgi:hypothetical protein